MPQVQQTLTVYRVPIDSIMPYDGNAKVHNEKQVKMIASSIKEFGWSQPIAVDEQNVIIAGHGRLLAAKSLGLEQVPVSVLTGLSQEQIIKLRLLDNKLNESERDTTKLLEELALLEDMNFGDMQLSVADLFPESEVTGMFGEDHDGNDSFAGGIDNDLLKDDPEMRINAEQKKQFDWLTEKLHTSDSVVLTVALGYLRYCIEEGILPDSEQKSLVKQAKSKKLGEAPAQEEFDGIPTEVGDVMQ